MKQPEKVVITVDELIAATKDAKCEQIAIRSKLTNVPSVRLSPGQSLRGIGVRAGITFVEGADGLQLSSNNKIRNINLTTSPNKRAIFNDTNIDTLGRMELRGVTAIGQIQIVARNKVPGGHVIVDGVDIVSADARGQTERPVGYGVNVLQGAFTLWNQHSDRAIVLKLLETGEIFSDGKIAPGTPDQITGGVFVVYGAHVKKVRNRKPVTTYGVNDMVLDNWGRVDNWTAEKKITSHGPSGIGFVNFGTVKKLKVNAPIETFGQGARGFNVYTGTVELAEFRPRRNPRRRRGRNSNQPTNWPPCCTPRDRNIWRHRPIAGQRSCCDAFRHCAQHQARGFGS